MDGFTARGAGRAAAQPLAGLRVVVTRPADRAAALSGPLSALGATVIALPATRLERLDPAPALAAVRSLAAYDWLVFTSQPAVECFRELMRKCPGAATALRELHAAAVGPATAAAIETLGIPVAVTPRTFAAQGLLDALCARDDVRGARMLYLAARGAGGELPAGLRAAGARVDVVPLYRSVSDVAGARMLRGALLEGAVDVVTFTAGSAVRALVDAVGLDAAARARIVTIGPVTSSVVRAQGLAVHAEAKPSTLSALVDAVVALRP